MKQLLFLIFTVFLTHFVSAVTCANAIVIPGSTSLPYTSAVTCGTTNDITGVNSVSCGSTNYKGGQEALYVWTPTNSYTNVTVAYNGVTYSGVFVYQNCPTSLSTATCLGFATGSGTSKTLTLTTNIVAGNTYYIMFDTWPTPNSPCPGSFTINGTQIFLPTIASAAISPNIPNCSASEPRTVSANVTIASGSISTVSLNYSINGVSQTPIAMTNTGGSTYSGTIPSVTPANAIVSWNISAVSSFSTTSTFNGLPYNDLPLVGVYLAAAASPTTVCLNGQSTLSAVGVTSSLATSVYADNFESGVAGYAASGTGSPVLVASATYFSQGLQSMYLSAGSSANASATQSTAINLTTLSSAILEFDHILGSEPGWDYGIVEYSPNGGTTWLAFPTNSYQGQGTLFNSVVSFSSASYTGWPTSSTATPTNSMWKHEKIQIPSAALTNNFKVRFRYTSDGSVNYFGWYIDDVKINVGLPQNVQYAWYSSDNTQIGTGLNYTHTISATDNFYCVASSILNPACTVTSAPVTVTATPLPAAPIATNSTQCGTQVPTASVASAAGVDGTGDYFWYDAATNGNLVQNSSWLTQIDENFAGPNIASNGLLSGVASLTGGWLRLTPATNSQQGGITVQPGVNGIEYKIDFDYKSNTTSGADGFSWSFAPDANATQAPTTDPADVASAELGTGSKLKISFDSYGGTMPNQKGTYVLYNNVDPSFTNTSAGVLASTTSTPWLSTASKHITITISQTGMLNMSVDGISVFSNIALPASYLTEDKSTWKHVFAARTGGVNMTNEIDNLKIQYKLVPSGSTTYNTPLASNTTFYVTELGVNGCYSPLSPVSISVSQPAPITYANSASTICIGESVTLNLSSTIVPPYAYTVSSPNAGAGVASPATGSTHTFTPTASGSIPYIVTAANGNCTEVDTLLFSVVPGASPAPIIAMDTITICPSATSAAFTASPSAMNVPYTFNLFDSFGDGWNGNTLNVMFNGVLEQSLTITGSYPTATSFSTTINVPEGTVITTEWTLGDWLNECSFNIVVGGATVHSAVMTTAANIASQMYSGSVPSYNYTFNWYSAATGGTLLGTGATFETIGTSVLPNLNTAGQYTVYAVQSNACLSAATPAIVNVTNVLAEILPIDASCNSVANGSFSLGTVSCGTSPFTYSVDGGSFGAIPTNLAYGNHTVIVKDATGAVAPVVTIFINQPTWITNVPNFVANGWACKDAPSEVISAANPNLTQTQTINLGTVSIVAAQSVTLNPALNLPVGATITGATLQLNGMTTTGLSYANEYNVVVTGLGTLNTFPTGQVVTNANYSFPLANINPNGTGINVVVTNTWNGGAGVINNVSLVVSYTIPQILDNITWYAAPTGGTSLGSGFTLETVGTLVLPNTATPGVYNFYAQGELDGCSSFTRRPVSVTIQAPTVVANMQTATVCPGQFLTLNATGGLTYNWSNGAGQNSPFVPAPTAFVGATQSYVVNGFDIDGCANQDTVVVTVLPQPILNGGVDQAICAGIPVILNASTTTATATPVTSFQWSNNVPNNTQFVPNNTATLTVTATGANGCTTQDAVVITVLALPVVNAGQDITVCAGLSATLNATGAVSYAWNNGVAQGIPFYPNATQTYTVVGTAANGCTNTDQVIVAISTGPTVNLSAPQTVCANVPASLSAAVQNSLGGFWITTNGTGVISPNVTNGTVNYTPSVNDPAVVNLTYVATNACGSASQNTTVTVLPIPVVNAGSDFAVCQGTSATLTATGTGFLTWTTPNVTNGIAFIPTATATYNVVATGFNNCTNNDQVTVTVLALPDVNAGSDQTICSGESVTLNGEGAVSYQWTGGAANNVSFAPTTTATYTVTGTGINGCVSSDQVTVVVNATPVATISVVNDITLAASPAGMNYTWINCASGTDVPNGSTANFTAIANGSYAVIVTSAEGCADQSGCEIISSVGLDQIDNIEMSVQPNPTAGELTINMPASLKATAQVFDAQGKLVQTESNVENGTVLHLESMTTGVYMVRISSENTVQTFRVVKQ